MAKYLLLLILTISLAGQNTKPKNIIILIGDGMGLSQVSSAVLTDANSAFRKFPVLGLSITCSADKLITDSAAGATALATGRKTNNKWISVAPDSTKLETVLELAKRQGKSAGVVVTSTVTNATPAAFLAHGTDRSKERDLAQQYPSKHWDVIVGGGRQYFEAFTDTVTRTEYPDNINTLLKTGHTVYLSADAFLHSAPANNEYALIAPDGVTSASQRKYSLGDLTSRALQALTRNKKGFVLMVEGSQIDWALHEGKSAFFETEMRDFNTALYAALDFAKKDGNTLVVVTADHETGGLSINGGKADTTMLTYKYTTGGHTASLVGVFAYGTGSQQFSGVMENTDIGKKLLGFLSGKLR